MFRARFLASPLPLLALVVSTGCGLEKAPGPGLMRDSGVSSDAGAGGRAGSMGGEGGAGPNGGSSGESGTGSGGNPAGKGGSAGAGKGGSAGQAGSASGTGGSEAGANGAAGTEAGTSGSSGAGGTTGCTGHPDCPPDHPHCAANGECTACTGDESCTARPTNPRCQLAAGNLQGQCVACLDNPDCPAATPKCTTNNTCISECTNHDDCTDPARPQCTNNLCTACTADEACTGRTEGTHCVLTAGDSAVGTCVACTAHDQCANPTPQCTNHECTKCTNSDACTGRTGTEICDSTDDATYGGKCVQCTGKDYSTCTQGALKYVCDSLVRSCSTAALEKSADACQPCISDAQCQVGKLCVFQTFDDPLDAPNRGSTDIGYFCAWRKDAASGPAGSCFSERPFIRTVDESAENQSIDGIATDLCVLAVTTCPAYSHYRSKDCKSQLGTADDTLCGKPVVDDGYCVQVDASTFRCSTYCGGDDDCKAGFSCNAATSPDTCSLN